MKSKKKALFQSLISLILCFSMLVGTTFAWFTDSVSSGTNIIATGNLDVEMEYLDSDGNWKKVDENTEVLDKDALWEPGHTEVAYLKISNAGNLALKYALGIGIVQETGSINSKGDPFKLSNYIEFGVVENESEVVYTERTDARDALNDSKKISEGFSSEYTLNSNGDVRYATLVVYMPEEVGNVANYATGETPPEIKLGIELVATQADYESDSFGTGYDTEAEMPGFSFPQNVFGDNTSADVTTDAEDKVIAGITIQGANTNAIIPVGVQLEEGTKKLTLEVTSMNQSGANVTLNENEAMRSLNVHVQGVSENNEIPMEICIKEAAAKGLNAGNLKLYHVENDTTVEMTAVDTFTAHNQFKYDPATGDITVYMATFSEVALVADTTVAWNGGFDYTWYDANKTELTIANADQLAAFGAIVGGMNGQTQDDFEGQTIKLIADINLADDENNNTDKIFYPIGYYNSTGSYEKVSDGAVTSNVSSFSGTFDGQGHTIKNFYQNTWEMFGDYNDGYDGKPNHYKDAMGLFGYVLNGSIQNLTVDNFSSDGEFTPTGVIAAYAVNSTFENIAITNCNPRVYNTGNGGIIGIAGRENEAIEVITLKNITVDNSNKISALWGSWDVACGGLVGMYRGNADGNGNATGDTISFENCHVAAQIDVYNDVCANYQYYAYRYAGMIIGSIRHNTTNADGKTIPNMAGVSASGCTVNYGDWNDYYYCEFEKNTMASYSEDYQFSRVPNDEIDISAGKENAKCIGHNHTEAEDKQAVYLPFHQLFTGYSWGVSSIGLKEYSGIVTDLGITEGNQNESVEKFETNFKGDFLYRVGTQNAVNVGTMFAPKDDAIISSSGVYVTITSQHDDNIIMGSFTAPKSDVNKDGNTDWQDGQIKFDKTGIVKVTIQDYDYCTPTVLYLEVVDAENITSAKGSNGIDVVLLSNVKISSGGTANYQNCTVYGNGFTFDVCGGMNQYNSKQGHGIIIVNNATLDHLRVEGEVYDEYGMYTTKDMIGNPQNDYTAAIDATNSIIQNCYIANCATPIRSKGNTIIDTTLYGGTVANLLISSGTNTLTNVTTVNYNDGRDVIGMGIVITDGASADSTKLILNGYLKQYNYVYETDINAIKGDEAKTVFNSMFEDQFSDYHVGSNPKAVNTGIISINEDIDLDGDVFTDNANTGYKITNDVSVTFSAQGMSKTIGAAIASVSASGNSVNNGYVDNGNSQGNYLPTPSFNLGTQAVNGEDRYLKGDINGVEARYVNGEEPFTLDITKLMTVTKYGKKLTVTASCKDADDKVLVATNGIITLDTDGSYVLEFVAKDDLIYSVDGKLTGETIERYYEVPLTLDIAEPAIKDAVITVNKTALDGGYNESYGDRSYKFNPLNAITITDVEGTVNLTTNIASSNIVYASSSSAFAGATTITVTYNDGRILTIVLGKPSLNSPGSSKSITYANDGTIKSAAKVASKSATGGTWTVTSYSFKGTNGKTVTNNTAVTFTFPDKSCVTGDTMVMLADGSEKRIDEVSYCDKLLVWNFFTGKYDVVPSAIIFYHGDDNYEVLQLNFSDGTTVKVLNNHGFYDFDENEFVFIDKESVDFYIGHNFVKVNGTRTKTVELVSYEIYEEYTGCYSIQSAMHNNFMVEGMFSLTIPAYEGWFDYFEIGECMKYDEAKMQADIEKYGLYTYEDFDEYVTFEQFIAFNGPYLKVLVGRGVVTYEQILALIKTYVPQ